MNPVQISALLAPFLAERDQPIAASQLSNISAYLELLLKWNTRTNLTAVRTPEEIVTRHFGESLFAARHIFLRVGLGDDAAAGAGKAVTLADVGSGAGFPGLPIKLWAPHVHVTLIESQHKKVTFLREVIRTLELTNIEVQATRAEQITQTFDTVTLRAVERFDQVLATAAKLVRAGGRLALLIGEDQIPTATAHLPTFKWENPYAIPNSQRRVLFLGASPLGNLIS